MIPREFEAAAKARPIDEMAFPRFDTATIERNIRRVLKIKKLKLGGLEIPENKFVEIMDLCFEEYRARGHRIFVSGRVMGIFEIRSELAVRARVTSDALRNRGIFRFRIAMQRLIEQQQKRAEKLGCCEEEKVSGAGGCLRCDRGVCACMTPLPVKFTLDQYLDTLCANVLAELPS